jgi:hypothetical protein
VGLVVLTILNIQIMVLFDAMPCSLVDSVFTNILEEAVSSIFVKMEAAGSCKILMFIYKTDHIPHNCDLNVFNGAGT